MFLDVRILVSTLLSFFRRVNRESERGVGDERGSGDKISKMIARELRDRAYKYHGI